ncbi:MAG: hypothetical protein EXS00_02060 [Phycisphaerales bacterium]|nr:hypothetical protein [Phycisphaerales bacterium]
MRWLVLLLCVLIPFLTACPPNYVKEDRTDTRSTELGLTHAVGGTHWCSLLDGDRLFVGFGTKVLVLDPLTGQQNEEIQVMPLGSSGAVVDLCLHLGDLIVVLDRTAVARVDLRDSRDLVVVEVATAEQLGVRPSTVASIDGDLWISGHGGVVRAADGAHMLRGENDCGRVVRTSLGLAAPVGRTVKLVEDGRFIGSATSLQPWTDTFWMENGFVFILQAAGAASVGIMGPDLRERVSMSVPGAVSDAFVAQGRIWAVTSTEIIHWRIDDDKLSDPQTIPVKGAIEVTPLRENYFLVAGTFGRALYRIESDSQGKGDEFFAVTRAPGRIDLALGDRRRILASSPEGIWQYTAGDECELVNKSINIITLPTKSVQAAWGKAWIATDADAETGARAGSTVMIEGTFGTQLVSTQHESEVRDIELIDGDLWVCHEEGIAVLRATGEGMILRGALRIPGPILFVFPRTVGGGASYVSSLGGMGVCEWVRIGEPVVKN